MSVRTSTRASPMPITPETVVNLVMQHRELRWQADCDPPDVLTWRLLFVVLGLPLMASCGRAQAGPPPPVTVDAEASATKHGDHNPHHGGNVYMYKDLHYELVLGRNGRHRLYFSDALREDLPASVASGVKLTIGIQGRPPEILNGSIDDEGESWMANGSPVESPTDMVRVEFVVGGEPYWIDVPFIEASP